MLKNIAVLLAAAWAAVGLAASAHAATLFETTAVLANTPDAQGRLPKTIEFDVPVAGEVTVSLRDLNTPVLLTSLRAVVTADLKVAAELELDYPDEAEAPEEPPAEEPPPEEEPELDPPVAPAPATITFTAAAGHYRVHVVGTVDEATEGGSFGVTVTQGPAGASLVDAVDTIAAANVPAVEQSVLKKSFEIANDGSYELELTDLAFPEPLASTSVLLLYRAPGGDEIVAMAPGPFTAVAGTYELIVIATAGTAEQAGLYSVRISGGPASALVYPGATDPQTNAVGRIPPATALTLPADGDYMLTLADPAFPAALQSFHVAVVQGTALLGGGSVSGTTTIPASKGAAELFVIATPAESGALSVRLALGTQVAYADVTIADASPDAGTPAIYVVRAPALIDAGSYRLTLRDFGLPTALSSLKAAIVQRDNVIARLERAGDLTTSLQRSDVKVLVAANGDNGLFGLSLVSQANNTAALETTQGVGGLFRSSVVQVPVAGRYDLTLVDLEFPERLSTSTLAITHGTDIVAQIFGAGTVPGQQLAAGTYIFNFIGQPATDEHYGAYALKVSSAVPAPTVTLSATATSITSGQRASLQWSSTNATACTSSGGWSGAKAVNGTDQSGVLNATTSFDISCSGPGGASSASVTVAVNAPAASGKRGGGGSAGALLVLFLGALAVVRRSFVAAAPVVR